MPTPITTTSVTNPYTDYNAGNAPPATTASASTNLAGAAGAQNLSAVPTIDSLMQQIESINQQAYLSAPGRQQELGTIQNELAGNLDPSTIYQNQLKNAEQYGAGGFSGDSQAWQTAIQRGLGIDRQNLITAGQGALNSFYSGLPTVNAQSMLTTPALVQEQAATAGAQSLQEQQIQNQANQSAIGSAQKNAGLYAGTYGNIPGYNEFGQYTGQIGNVPTAGQYSDQGGTASEYLKSLAGSTAGKGGTSGSPANQQMGYDAEGNWVQGGKFRYGYFDPYGHFFGNKQMPDIQA